MAGEEVIKRHDKVYFTFGRFNPPHSGHAKLIQQLAEDAGSEGDAYAFVTSTQDRRENPLDVYTKVEFLQKQNPATSVRFINTTEKNCKQIKQCVQLLLAAGYAESDITLVVGKDQYDAGSFEFLQKMFPAMKFRTTALLDRSNKMSATEMREAARSNNRNKFRRGTQIGSMKEENTLNLLRRVREGMGLGASRGRNRSRSRNRNAGAKTQRRR